jgi:hypothetical protein
MKKIVKKAVEEYICYRGSENAIFGLDVVHWQNTQGQTIYTAFWEGVMV